MSRQHFVTIGLLVLLVAVGATDAILTGEQLPIGTHEGAADDGTAMSSSSEAMTGSSDTMAMSSSSAMSQEPVMGTRRRTGPNVLEVLTQEQFTFQETDESNILGLVVPEEAGVESRIILKDKDRAGLIVWADSPQVKNYFIALKEALHTSFSPQVTDLLDELQSPEGKPPRNLLTFLDPGISEERIVFIRIQSRLYEFHIAEGHDEEIFDLIEALTI